ncbi:ABC transporter substrate-binding protein [Paenibacillus sp. WLX1005]|uniref:ABC transporter substrate-binding protein n=1 Tax=Paenibacillus sp. WLX1005 TaxID=3243766 RepID=UPI003983F9D1
MKKGSKHNHLCKLTAAVLATSLLLSACGNSADVSTSGDDNAANNDAKVSFTIGYAAGDPAAKKAIADTIERFEQQHPEIAIKDLSENSSSSYLDWLKTKDAVGEFPDLVEMRDTEIFADAGKIVELPSDLVELFDSPPKVEGKVWNAPLTVNAPQGIIYSKKAYADAGITQLPTTYDEFLTIQDRLQSSGMTPIVVGGKDIFHMGFWVNKFLIDDVYAHDPDWNGKKTAGKAHFTDENVVQAMTDYKYLFQNYVDKGWLSTPDNQTISFLISGKAAQLYSGTWMFSQIEEADPTFEYGFYAVPDRQGNVNVIGLPSPAGWSLSTEASKDPAKTEAITTFIRFFFEPEQYSQYLASINGIASTKEKVTYPTGEAMKGVLALMDDPKVNKSLAINNWWGDNLIPPQFRNWFYKKLQEMVLTDGDVKSYMQQIDTEYDNEVKANAM